MDMYKKTALIGYTGFVGQNLHFKHKFTNLYNSKNISTIQNQTFDLMICSGIPATKWLANKYPIDDLNNINTLLTHLKTITVTKFILISTIDVYSHSTLNQNEDTQI